MGAISTHPSLLERLRDRGDEEAWREFNGRYRDLVLRYCQNRGLQRWDAEDVCQVVMLSLVRALPGFRYDRRVGRFRTYLGRVVQNAAARHRMGHHPAPLALEPDSLLASVAADAEADGAWEVEWRAHHLRVAFDTLRRSGQDRSLSIFDRLLGGASVRQVAGELGMSEQAVHKVKQRVRDRLRECVTAQLRDEDGSASDPG